MATKRLTVALGLAVAMSACARDDVRCHTHPAENGDLTECQTEAGAG